MRHSVFGLIAACLTALGIIDAGAIAQCGRGGSCLIAHPTPGCDDRECCNVVCASDPLCCEFGWDADCVHAADISCIGLCGAAVSGDCFVPHANPGCDDLACCETVCAIDPFCCEQGWDTTCAFEASFNCQSGGDFECGQAGSGSCFEPHGNSACDDFNCCTAICKIDPSCCENTWDILCANLAFATCVDGCTPPCPPGSLVEAEPCDEDINDPCYFPSPNPTLQTLPCGAVACGSLTTFSSPVEPDIDVWEVTLVDGDGDGLVAVRVALASAFNGFASLVSATGCPPLSSAVAHVNSSLCVDAIGEVACVPPGSYRVVVAPGDWPTISSATISCAGNNKYKLQVLCTDNGCGPACDPQAGPCFQFHKGVGCNDVECCTATCAEAPTCCTLQWDEICAEIAIELCAPPVPNDVCATALNVVEGATPFTTIGATTEGTLPPPINCVESGGNPIVHDVWFHYKPAKDTLVQFTTCGQPLTFNSGLVLYTGTCTQLQFIVCDDDGTGACLPSTASKVAANVDCGKDYYIRIGGGYGDGTLTITQLAGGPACPSPCVADLDGNDTVGSSDLGILLGAWGGSGPADLDGNGTVGSSDLGILLGAWGPCP